ncbi:MAG: hypothetical protein J1E95_03795 [Muribaculaceae bacterium]|nr:hypothetical protein [Muribaculaceae bacterium]
MMKNYILSILALIFSIFEINAQTIYSEPSPLQENSSDVKVYFNAVGTKLEGLNATTKIYAHTGCDLSDGQTWISAPNWGNNAEKYQLSYVSENLWMLYIGDIRSYYGITDSKVNVVQLDFVFRTADGNTQTTNLYLTVYAEGLQLTLTSNAHGDIITPESAYVTFTVNVTEEAKITLYVNDKVVNSEDKTTGMKYSYLFPETGEYTVKATAEKNSNKVEETLTLHYVRDSRQVDYPGGKPKMGPVKSSDGSVTFCFGAPEKEHVVLVGSWNNYAYSSDQVLNYQDTDSGRYFWITIDGLDNDTMYAYYFIVDGDYTVGDPYARLVLDPWNDKDLDTGAFPGLPEYPWHMVETVPLAVYQGSINDYNWKVKDFVGADPSNLIIYELLFRDFTGTEGEAYGNGTVRKAIEKIPYLIDLGVNAIEVLPIMEFSGNISWGYNPNFYFAVDKAYGTPDDYKEFIDICHQNGIAVILDMVFNQSDGLHPWYQMYEPGKNPFYNLDAPHAYSVLNDWNQGMPMVQEQWADVLRYWMTEYKFDGFRFDLVKGLGLNTSYANNGEEATNAYNSSRVAEMRYLQGVMDEINPNAYFINENLATAREENEMAQTGQLNWANVNNAACQFAMGYKSDSNMNRLYAPKDSRTWGSTVSYLESHDEQRLAYKQDQWGESGVKGNVQASMQRCGAAAAQMILSPGAHMIWQFSEMGNAENTKTSQGNNTDPKIVNWNLLNEPNHKGLLNSYRDLISIRNRFPELFTEEACANFIINCDAGNWNNGRWLFSSAGGKELYTFINPNITGNLTIKFSFPKQDSNAYGIVSKSYNSNPSFDVPAGTVTVPANCYVTIGSADLVAGIDNVLNENQERIFSVRTHEGEIIVDYAEGGTVIYSLDGRKVGTTGETGNLMVTPGIYIVKGIYDSIKVIVK